MSPTDNWGNRITSPHTLVSFVGTDQGGLEVESDPLTKTTGLRLLLIIYIQLKQTVSHVQIII